MVGASYLELYQVLGAELFVLAYVASPRLLHQSCQTLVHLHHPPHEALQCTFKLRDGVFVVLKRFNVESKPANKNQVYIMNLSSLSLSLFFPLKIYLVLCIIVVIKICFCLMQLKEAFMDFREIQKCKQENMNLKFHYNVCNNKNGHAKIYFTVIFTKMSLFYINGISFGKQKLYIAGSKICSDKYRDLLFLLRLHNHIV